MVGLQISFEDRAKKEFLTNCITLGRAEGLVCILRFLARVNGRKPCTEGSELRWEGGQSIRPFFGHIKLAMSVDIKVEMARKRD